MEKLKFIRATAYPKDSERNQYQPIEILIPVEAIASLSKMHTADRYDVYFKKSYDFGLTFTPQKIQANISSTHIEILS